ncbi:hypothetical protein [Anaerotruncus sp.]|uniref:hypothetical protein n=1 Tax=Anaerotruncus TaxID=244127 RepID=UPI00217195AB|nr:MULTISPECIES: hypothetical protein [Anaerotruncus]MCI8494001.1 hypothetical protein [Anaerotruncus sp.]
MRAKSDKGVSFALLRIDRPGGYEGRKESNWNSFYDLEESSWAVDSKPPEGGPRLVRVTLADGNTITTRINGTDEEILAYYRVGSTLNVGAVRDDLVEIAAVEIVANG